MHTIVQNFVTQHKKLAGDCDEDIQILEGLQTCLMHHILYLEGSLKLHNLRSLKEISW